MNLLWASHSLASWLQAVSEAGLTARGKCRVHRESKHPAFPSRPSQRVVVHPAYQSLSHRASIQRRQMQEYLTDKRMQPPRTLPQAYA